MVEFVDIYYSGPITSIDGQIQLKDKLLYRRAESDAVKDIIIGWVEGGIRRGRTWRKSGFYTKPTMFPEDISPIRGVAREEFNKAVDHMEIERRSNARKDRVWRRTHR